MRVTGARLVDPQRVAALADLARPLPAAHDPLHAPVLPGRLCERVLVVDFEDARVGDALVVRVYPVAQGGTTTVLVAEPGRARCFATLRPAVERTGDVTVDVEWRGQELWAEELRIGTTAETLAQALAAPRRDARAHEGHIDVDGPHRLGLTIEAEPGRVVGRFACDAPAPLVARPSVRAHPWHRLPWEGPLDWFAEDPSRVGADTLSTFRLGAARLARQEDVEVRLDPWGGTIVVLCRALDVVAAERIVSAVVDAVRALPAPTAERPPPGGDSRATAAALPPLALVVTEAAVLDAHQARACLARTDEPLPRRDDAFHAREPGELCRLRTLVARVNRPRDCPPQDLWVWLDDEPAARLCVPAGTGPCLVSADLSLRLFEQSRVLVRIRSEREVLWLRPVAVGSSREVFLGELAHRLPAAVRRGDSVFFFRDERPRASLQLWTELPEDAVARDVLALRDPLVRLMARLRGERPGTRPPGAAGGEGPPDGEPACLELVLPRATAEELAPAIEDSPFTLRSVPGGTAILGDVHGADVSQAVETAAAMLRAAGLQP